MLLEGKDFALHAIDLGFIFSTSSYSPIPAKNVP